MKNKNADIFAAAQHVGDAAPLKTKKAKPGQTLSRNNVPVRMKNIRLMPVDFFERHEALRVSGMTPLDFSAYIIEAVRERLAKDENKE